MSLSLYQGTQQVPCRHHANRRGEVDPIPTSKKLSGAPKKEWIWRYSKQWHTLFNMNLLQLMQPIFCRHGAGDKVTTVCYNEVAKGTLRITQRFTNWLSKNLWTGNREVTGVIQYFILKNIQEQGQQFFKSKEIEGGKIMWTLKESFKADCPRRLDNRV